MMIRNEIHYAPILPRTSDITSISKWEPSSCYFEYYLGTYERVQFILKYTQRETNRTSVDPLYRNLYNKYVTLPHD